MPECAQGTTAEVSRGGGAAWGGQCVPNRAPYLMTRGEEGQECRTRVDITRAVGGRPRASGISAT